MRKLDEIQKEIHNIKNQLSLVPQLEQRLWKLVGMEEILMLQEKENEKPDLKLAKNASAKSSGPG